MIPMRGAGRDYQQTAEKEAEECPRCDGKGWHWSLPRGVNPFEADIMTNARRMRKITCDHVIIKTQL